MGLRANELHGTMTEKVTLTVEVENDAVNVERLVNERDVDVVLKETDEPIQATIGPAIGVGVGVIEQ